MGMICNITNSMVVKLCLICSTNKWGGITRTRGDMLCPAVFAERSNRSYLILLYCGSYIFIERKCDNLHFYAYLDEFVKGLFKDSKSQ